VRQRPAPDLVNRNFVADAPNRLWVTDMTYVLTWAGFIFLAVVLDVWSRRVVGWAIGESMTGELVLAALNMALEQRRPCDVVHHSDQGSQPRFNWSSQHCFALPSVAVH
jgi:putative transposase